MADLERFKLSNVIYDSDKNITQDGFFAHVDTFGNIVRSCASGYYLEDMLDSKLHRSSIQQGSVPSLLLSDPDFAGPAPMIEATNPDDPEDEPEEAVEQAAVEDDNASVNATFASAAVGSATTGSTFKLGVHKIAYKDLPLAARKLAELMLYCITSSN